MTIHASSAGRTGAVGLALGRVTHPPTATKDPPAGGTTVAHCRLGHSHTTVIVTFTAVIVALPKNPPGM